MVFGAIAGLGGSASSFLGDPLGTNARDDANKANTERWLKALREIDRGREEMTRSLGGRRGDLLKSLDASRGGYKDAIGLLNQSGSGQRLAASQGAQKALGGIQSQLQRRGLGGSSAAANAARGVVSDLTQTEAGIQSRTAGQQAGLTAQMGESQASILRSMATQRLQDAEALARWRRDKANLIVGREDVAAPGWLPQLAGAAGSFASLFSGGGGGGA